MLAIVTTEAGPLDNGGADDCTHFFKVGDEVSLEVFTDTHWRATRADGAYQFLYARDFAVVPFF